MPEFLAFPADITLILFFAVNIVSTIAAVIRRKNTIVKIFFNIIFSVIFIFELAVLTIIYDDIHIYYYPDDDPFFDVSYHEYSDDKNLIVIRKRWFLTSGFAEIYLIDENRNAFEIGRFSFDDNIYYRYDVEIDDIGVKIKFPHSEKNFFFSFEQE